MTATLPPLAALALSAADRMALAAGLLVFALLLAGRWLTGLLAHRRRHGVTQRLERVQALYTLSTPARQETVRRRPARARDRDTGGILARAQVPNTRLGRLRHRGVQRVRAAGGRAALPWLAAGVLGPLAGVPAVLGAVLSVQLTAPLAVAAAVLGGNMALRRLESRMQTRFLQEFPEALDMIVRAVQAGLPVSQALSTSAAELTGPVGMEFRRISDELAIGLNLETALANAAQRVPLPDFRFFVVTLALQHETGGRLSETLSNLSQIVRTRDDVRAKVRALTADGRASAVVVSVLPLVVAGGLLVVNPGYLEGFVAQPLGQVMIAVATVLVLLGIVVVRRMVRVET